MMRDNNNTKVELIKRVHEQINNNSLVREFRLVNGNCGIFAIALKEMIHLGELCLIYDIDEREEKVAHHIVLRTDEDEYLDGEGVHSKQELIKRWNHDLVEPISDEPWIIKETCRNLEVEDMKVIIDYLMIGATEKAREYYNKNRNSYILW